MSLITFNRLRVRGRMRRLEQVLSAILVGTITLGVSGCTKSARELIVWSKDEAYSADPYEFNSSVHHLVFGPTFARMFTAYKDARIEPTLVKSWVSNSNYTEWKFKLRSDFYFNNGDRILNEHVLASVKRFLLLAKKNKSTSSLLLNLRGATNIESMNDEVEGLKIVDDQLVFSFRNPERNLPETLAFGLYSVVHPKDFNAVNGAWAPKSIPITSGPYEISHFSREEIRLSLRKDFPKDQTASRPFEKIVYYFTKEKRQVADLFRGYEGEPQSNEDMEFKGKTNDNVLLLRIVSWLDPKSPLSSALVRISLREQFYKNFQKRGNKIWRSLYPSFHVAAKEAKMPTKLLQGEILKGNVITYQQPTNTLSPVIQAYRDSVIETFEAAGAKVDFTKRLTHEEYMRLKRLSPGEQAPIDVVGLITTIGNEDPRETTKLMFSKEGIYIPDPSGKVRKIIRDQSFDIADVNQILYDDGIMWPVAQLSHGFWVNTSKVDLSRYNHQWPLSELQWMGAK